MVPIAFEKHGKAVNRGEHGTCNIATVNKSEEEIKTENSGIHLGADGISRTGDPFEWNGSATSPSVAGRHGKKIAAGNQIYMRHMEKQNHYENSG